MALSGLLGLLACGGSQPGVPGALRFVEVPLDTEFSEWTELKFVPGTDEFLALQKDGTLRHFRLETDGAVQLGSLQISTHDDSDCGAIAMAFDPQFVTNRLVYVSACVSETHSGVFRFEFDSGDYESTAASRTEVLVLGDDDADRPWHNVGSLGFFEDGTMWVLFGDKTVGERAQDEESPLGAMLRIQPRTGLDESGYDVPADNPLVGGPGADEVYALGLRSPWRGGIDGQGRVWIGDVGSEAREELNVVTEAGTNFGWNSVEGPCPPADMSCQGFDDPVTSYVHSGGHPYESDDGEAVASNLRVIWTGDSFVPRTVDPYDGLLDGKVLFGDMCVGFIRAVELSADGELVKDEHMGHLRFVSSLAQGPDDHLYLSTYGHCATGANKQADTSRLWRIELD